MAGSSSFILLYWFCFPTTTIDWTCSVCLCLADEGLPGADRLLQGVSVQTGRRLRQRRLRHGSQGPQVSQGSISGVLFSKPIFKPIFIISPSSLLPLHLQLHGGSESSSEGCRFPDEEGARLLCHGPGETSEAVPGHPRRVRNSRLWNTPQVHLQLFWF